MATKRLKRRKIIVIPAQAGIHSFHYLLSLAVNRELSTANRLIIQSSKIIGIKKVA
jgi:hypothetical protein